MAYLTPESRIKNEIIKWLTPLDHKHGGTLYWKRRDAIGANYEKGIPDLYIVIGSTHIEVETKAPGGSLSTMQERWRSIFINMGTPYILAVSLKDFLDQIAPYLNKKS